VLTVPGKSFASRFCASIVSAAGVPELICSTPDEYVAKAVGYAKNPASLAAVRASIQSQRDTSALRDMPAMVRRLEELCWQMQGECERGETPTPDMRNLDIYYEIGVSMLGDAPEFETEEAYRKRYLDKLTEWNSYEPLVPDARLWPQAKA
jgi:hypothetical protein